MEELKPEDLGYLSRFYRLATFARKVFARPDQVAVLRRREQVREELLEHLDVAGPGTALQVGRSELIVAAGGEFVSDSNRKARPTDN